MSDPSLPDVRLSAFKQHQHRFTHEVVYALEVTEPMINVLAASPGLEDLAKAAQPGDYIIGFENRVVSGEEFNEKYRQLGQT